MRKQESKLGFLIEEIREGLPGGDDSFEWIDRLQQSQRKIVPLTIVGIFVFAVGSCSLTMISSSARKESSVAAQAAETKPANPWALDNSGPS